jgi:Intracellular proteinase inhibitor
MSNPLRTLRRGPSRLATVLGILVICLGASSKSCRIIQDNIENRDDLEFATALTLQDAGGQITDTFVRGDQIQLVMTVRNELETTARVQFQTSRTFDFVILEDGTDDIVWQWSRDQTAQQTPTEMVFAPLETKTFTQIWNQVRSTSGLPVRTGTYEARGVLVFDGFDSDPRAENQMGSALVRFTIRTD